MSLAQTLYRRFGEFPWYAAMFERPYTFLVGMLLSLAIMVVTVLYVRSETTRSYEQSFHSAESITNLVHHHVDRDFAKIGVFLRMIRNEQMLIGNSGERHPMSGTSELFRLFPEIEALVVTDLSGREVERLVRSNSDDIQRQIWPVEPEVSEPMFDVQLLGPFRSPYSGEWVITLSIDLVTVSGEKSGHAFVSIQSSPYFKSVLSQPNLGRHGAASIRKQDFSLVYRSLSPNDDEIDSKITSTEIRDSIQRSPNNGIFKAKTALDGIERVNAYRKIGSYPLYVIVGLATSENLERWQGSEYLIGSLTALSVILTLVLSLTYAASAHRQRELNVQLTGKAKKLNAIFEGCSEGIHILDSHGRLIRANAAFYKLIGREEHESSVTVADWSSESTSALIGRFNALLSDPTSEVKRTTGTYFKDNGDRLQVEIGITKFDYDGHTAICASARDITTDKRNLEMLQYMLSEYRRLNEELEFRAQCCEVTHKECLPCLASTIPDMLSDWQELLLVFGAMQNKVPITTESDYAVLMDRARRLLDTMSEITHNAHNSSEFNNPVDA